MKERLSGFGRAVFFSFCVKKKRSKRKTAIGWGMAGGCLCVGKVAGATRNWLRLFMFSGARYVYRFWRAEQPAPLWPRDTGDPAPVPLYPWEPLTPFPRWGPAGPPSPDLGGSGLRPSSRLGLSFRRCAFPQQKATIIIVPVDGDHGVGSSRRPDNFQSVTMVCKALSVAKRFSSLPRSQDQANADRRRSGVQANPEARFRGGEAHAGRDPSQ